MSTSTQELKHEIKAIEAKPVNQTIAQIRSLAAGAAGGLCAVIVGHPFDLVKVRLQTAEKGVYSGAMDVVRKTVAREGLARVRNSQWVTTRVELTCDCTGSVCWCVRPACGRDSDV